MKPKGTKKIATALTVTIIKFKAVITPPQTFKRRSTTTKPRLASYTVSGTMMGPNINKTIKGKKLLEVIKTFNSDNAEDFIEAIGKCFPQQVEKEQKINKHNKEAGYKEINIPKSKYQLIDFSEFGVKILLRVSDHNINSSNIVEDIEEAYSIVFKSKKSPNTFRASNDEIDVTEYVYFTENCTRNKYRRIAQNIYNLLGTSQWDENNVPADVVNSSQNLHGLSDDCLGSIRTEPAPRKTITCYKLMRLIGRRLYPLFIDRSEPVELGVWYDADAPAFDTLKALEADYYYLIDNDKVLDSRQSARSLKKDEIISATKLGRRWVYIESTKNRQRRYGECRAYYNIGINSAGQKEKYAMRPGWHAGSLPTMRQIGKGAQKNLRDDSFVWTECEISADVDYNAQAQRNPDKDLPTQMPTNGFYLKATNADKTASQADKMGWYVAGAIKINRIIGDSEARQIIDRYNARQKPENRVLYDYEREGGRDFEPEKEKSQKKEEFLGTKKADNNVIDLLISFKKKDVRRSPNLVQNEHEHLICAFDSRLRPVSTPARRSNHLSGANNENSVEIKKLLDKKIKQWQKAKTLSLEDFMLFIALELRLRASKKNGNHFSYYISLFDSGDRYTLRISDHHYDASTSEYHNAKKTTALTFSSEITENWDYFKPDKTVHAIEYVYYEDKIGKDELIAIAKDVVSFVENGKYTPSVEPNEVHHSPGLEGVKRTATQTVESILASGRTDLSEAEKAILRAYAGNGGQGKRTTERGILDEYYTPDYVCEFMYRLAVRHGYASGRVLEPSCATGNCLRHIYERNDYTHIDAFEINETSRKICKALYPNVSVSDNYFETAFLEPPRYAQKAKRTWLSGAPYDLVIGNPPYGKHVNRYSSYFSGKDRFAQIEMFFIYKALELLRSGGLLVFIIGTNFMSTGSAYQSAKERIGEMADLVDAYRLPKVFAATDICTDIIVLQKK